MNLTGKQLVEMGIITNVTNPECIQQHGVDLELIRVQRIVADPNGVVPRVGKTVLAKREEVESTNAGELGSGEVGWYLEPGAYDITLTQGCKVPADKMLLIRQRSSLLRNGTILHSSVFDAGFETDKIGTVMIVHVPIFIHYGARVAQIYAHNSNEVDNLYNGQWQHDQQRKAS